LAFGEQRIRRGASAQSCFGTFARRTGGSWRPGPDFGFDRFPLTAAAFDLDLKGVTGMTHCFSFSDLLVC